MYGSDIKKIQNVLNKRGFNCGNIDGYYGNYTMTSVKQFQKIHNLDAGGIVGPKTWEKLFSTTTNNKIKTVCIDVDHGGKDPGACFDGMKEKDIVLDISLEVKKLLERKEIRVFLTRDTDIYLDENTRVNLVNNSNADILISNHINSSKGDGCEVFYSINNEIGKSLATKISENISNELKIKNRGTKTRVSEKG